MIDEQTPEGIKAAFELACERAMKTSKDEDCTKHVNAIVRLHDYVPVFERFDISDWYTSDSTLKSYTSGREH